MKRLIVSCLIILTNLNFSAWAFFLDPLGIFVTENIKENTNQPEKIIPKVQKVESVDTRTADFNSSFLIIGKITIFLAVEIELLIYICDF